MRRTYAERRDDPASALAGAGLTFSPPEGAYYVMADAGKLGWKDDFAFVDFLARRSASSPFPGSSFYARGGKTRARLNFAKKDETLHEAVRRLAGADLRAGRRRPGR